ncbi:MAG TPA: hypothetical protein VNN55_04770 [bacterium]|nr:hypothetical protein [bacterium]
MTIAKDTYRLDGGAGAGKRALIIGLVALAITGVGFLVDRQRFFHAYLTAYMFWLTIALGALFLVMLHYLVNARWSIVIRRLVESIMTVLPAMAILFLPILGGMHDLYHWTHTEAVAGDELLTAKAPYLNAAFFIARAAAYFAIWFVLARTLYRNSIAEDTRYDEARRAKTRKVAAGGMLLFAFTTTFAAFDWLMSLDPHWYSTIFGVYVFAGAALSIVCFVTILLAYLRRQGVLANVVGVEHYNDLGKLTFAFTIFWAYMAFSQYFIIWYANIPEETIWYQHRWAGSWKFVSLLLVIGHFVVPFILLLPKTIKRNLGFLVGMSLWLLLMQWVDLFWLVMPSISPDGAALSWIDPVAMVGIGGVFLWLFWRKFASASIIPVGDPRLDASIESLSL